MLVKYMKAVTKRTNWERVLREQRDARIKIMQSEVGIARQRLIKWETELRLAERDTQLHAMAPIEPPPMLIAACAAISSACYERWPLVFEEVVQRRFLPITGSGLSMALNDAIAEGWVTLEGHFVHWVPGTPNDCPLVLLAERFSVGLTSRNYVIAK